MSKTEMEQAKQREIEYILDKFPERFGQFSRESSGARIVLHGTREYAAAILDRFFDEYDFSGIASFEETENSEFHGVPVLSEEELFTVHPDLLILTERVRHEETAWELLSDRCREAGILLYDMYGLNVYDLLEHRKDYRVLTTASLSGWMAVMERHPAVCFEAMDAVLLHGDDGLTVPPLLALLIRKLLSRGDEVWFSLRKSYPEERQRQALLYFFPELSPERLIRREGEDLSFRALAERYPDGQVLYIGRSSLSNEWLLPQYYGFAVWRSGDRHESLMPKIPEAERYRREMSGTSMLGTRLEDCRKAIDESDVVSFDVFDTLLVRSTLCPEDVFELVRRRTGAFDSFAEYRRRAGSGDPGRTLIQIYKDMEQDLSCPELPLPPAGMADAEFAAERSVLSARPEAADLLRYAADSGKDVILTSDMYLTSAQIGQLLEENEITGYQRIFVSCEYGRLKQDGLFAEVRNAYGNDCRILHIGDNPEADSWCLTEEILYLHLPSVRQLAEESGWGAAIEEASGFAERSLIGLAKRRYFSDHGTGAGESTRLEPEARRRERLLRFADAVTGPILAAFTSWILRSVREEKIDQILFFARDGWLFYRLYGRLRNEHPEWNLPEAVYFYTSRHAAHLLCADDPHAREDILAKAEYARLTADEIPEKIYGLNGVPAAGLTDGMLHDIRVEAQKNTAAYLAQCGIDPEKRIAAVDLFAAGSTQRYLEQGLSLSIRGLYFGLYRPEPEPDLRISYYLQGRNERILRDFMTIEGAFTSPEPSVDRIGRGGEILFAEELRSGEALQDLILLHRETESFAEEYFRLFDRFPEAVGSGVVEELFAAACDPGVIPVVYDDLAKTEIRVKDDGT